MKKSNVLLLLLGLCQPLSSFADERLEHFLSLSLEELMDIQVTISTKSKQSVTNAPAMVSVITADDLRATGATNLVEALEGVPGIHIRYSTFGYRPLIQFRGANATQTLLMVNGVPMKDLMWGFGIFWKGLPVSMIDRVEIIRGPGSALFGADASAGVINVITRTASTIEESEFGARAGSFNTQNVWARHGGNWNGYEIGVTADIFTTDGHDPYIEADLQTADDPALSYAPAVAGYGWRSQDLRLSVAKGNWHLLADYMSHSELEIGMAGAGVLDPLTRASDSRYNVDLGYQDDTVSDNWGVTFILRHQHLDYTSGDGFQERPPGYDNGVVVYPDGLINRMRSAERRVEVGFSGLYRGFANHAITLGGGASRQELYRVEQIISDPAAPSQLLDVSDTPDAFAPEKDRDNIHLYLQDVWSVTDNLELTAGVRYDDYSDFGDVINPRLAVVWKSSPRLTTKLMYGEAFRAPSFRELYAGTSYAEPNPALRPETSQTAELAFAYKASDELQVGMNLFRYQQNDIIKRVTLYENVGDHTIRGVELEAHWQVARNLKFAANVTARSQEENDYRAHDEADREAYLRADWGINHDWNWNMQANWIGERPRSPKDSRPAAADYLLVDTTVRYARYDKWELAASVRNLLDEDARACADVENDLPLPERNFYVEASYKF